MEDYELLVREQLNTLGYTSDAIPDEARRPYSKKIRAPFSADLSHANCRYYESFFAILKERHPSATMEGHH